MRTLERPVEEKTLYVCVNNVGRSQIAEKFHNDHDYGAAESAGLRVDDPGGRVIDWVGGAGNICAAMEEIGKSISDNLRSQYDEEAAGRFGLVVFMLEPSQIPGDLDLHTESRRYWPVQDPRGLSIEEVRVLRDDIEKNVGMLATNRLAQLVAVYS